MLPFVGQHLANTRQSLAQVLNFALVLSTAFMLWKGLSVFTASSSPIVVVLSGSMEPAFQRGDLLFLWNRNQRAEVGEVVVYNVKGKEVPIVHRVVRSFPDGVEGPKGKKKGKKSEDRYDFFLSLSFCFFCAGQWLMFFLRQLVRICIC